MDFFEELDHKVEFYNYIDMGVLYIKKNEKLYILFRNASPPFKLLFFAIFLGVVSSFCSLILPILVKMQIDDINNGIAYKLIMVILIVFIVQLCSLSVASFLLSIIGNRIILNLRKNIWGKLLNAKIDFFAKNQSGEIVSRILTDTTAAMNLLSHDFARLITGILSIIGSIIFMIYLDFYLTIVLLFFSPIIILLISISSKKLRNISFLYYEYNSRVAGYLYKVLNGIRLIKASNTQNKEMKEGRKQFREIYFVTKNKSKIESILLPLINTLTLAMIVIVLAYGSYRIQLGEISSGDLLAFIFYAYQISVPIGIIGNFIASYQSFSGSSKRIIDILNLDIEEQRENGKRLSYIQNNLKYTLEVENICFKYEKNWVLNGISFLVQPGTITAIVGESGSGKSTLFYLLELFYKPTKGEIKLNSISFEEFSLSDWRDKFSYVSQDFHIFPGTIRENLTYGIKRDIEECELISICEEVNALDFINSLPEKLDTYLGENGFNISGGQKQRLAIARALLKEAPFLLLDEATANLDLISDDIIQRSLISRKSKQSIIIIAHRISSIINADQILVLNKGKIECIGKHTELLLSCDTYQKLTRKQFIS